MRNEFDGSKQGRKTRKSLDECKKCEVHKEKSREKKCEIDKAMFRKVGRKKTTAPRIPMWSPTMVLTRWHFG
jgi:hypothetical protein